MPYRALPSTIKDHSFTIPDECLEQIFTVLQVMDPVVRPVGQLENRNSAASSHASRGDTLRICDPAFGWVRITFVCRRWRYIAIGHTRLWATLTHNLGPRWLHEFIVRSKEALLGANDDDFQSDNLNDTLYNVVSAHHHRLYRLKLTSLVFITLFIFRGCV